MDSPEPKQAIFSWDQTEKDPYIEFKIRRNTLIAFLVSFLIHGLLLFAIFPKNLIEATSVASLPPKSLSVSIVNLPVKKPLSIIALKEAQPKKSEVKPKLPKPAVIAVQKNAAPSKPVFKVPAEENAPTDLMSYVKAKRQQSQFLEEEAAIENAAAGARAHIPTPDESRDAIIKRNLQQHGTNGIFEIRRISGSTGQFSFRGWKNDYSNSRLELIDVEAGPDGNIDLAIVKAMIKIIRREYKGYFNWESERLGRVVVLSAKMEDNAGLEDFMMQEFFSAQGNYRRP